MQLCYVTFAALLLYQEIRRYRAIVYEADIFTCILYGSIIRSWVYMTLKN
jgi:hypothetical protein